ncbi:hypothetical protein D3C87_1825820 [compost metagenome]
MDIARKHAADDTPDRHVHQIFGSRLRMGRQNCTAGLDLLQRPFHGCDIRITLQPHIFDVDRAGDDKNKDQRQCQG